MTELEERWRDLGEFIREQRHIGHLSLRKLSEMAGVSNPYLSQIERGLRKPSAEILQQIARALEISSETLYIRAGILEERADGVDLVAEIRRDPWIGEEQKRTLIQIYESFRAASPISPPVEPVPADESASEVDVVRAGVDAPVARIALLSLHTSPLAQPGSGDSGGMNVYVRELAAGLAHAGHRCDVYVRTDAEGLPARVPVEPGVVVHHVAAGPVDLAKEDLPAIVDEWADAVAAAIVARGGVDVVHANYWLSGVAGHRIKHALDVPLVSTFHTLARVKTAAGDPEPEARAQAEQAVMACSDAVLASCPAEARQLADLYAVPPSRIALVPPGVEHALFSPGPHAAARDAAGLADVGDAPVVLFVGRFQRLKGLDVAVQALDQLWARNAVLVACGGPSGSDGAATVAGARSFVADRGLDDRVRFLAPRPHHQLSSLYRAADVVVVPSRSESFGLVALEAAACGRPVVAADVGGLSSLVDHRRTGLLVRSRDPGAWAAALDSVLCLPDRATRMGRAAATLATGYGWATAARALAGVYAEVSDRGPLHCDGVAA